MLDFRALMLLHKITDERKIMWYPCDADKKKYINATGKQIGKISHFISIYWGFTIFWKKN